jgi:hypothetical protein
MHTNAVFQRVIPVQHHCSVGSTGAAVAPNALPCSDLEEDQIRALIRAGVQFGRDPLEILRCISAGIESSEVLSGPFPACQDGLALAWKSTELLAARSTPRLRARRTAGTRSG